MRDLKYKKEKNGMYVCTDELGRSAKGMTKENAKAMWFLYYGSKEIDIDIFNTNNVERKL